MRAAAEAVAGAMATRVAAVSLCAVAAVHWWHRRRRSRGSVVVASTAAASTAAASTAAASTASRGARRPAAARQELDPRFFAPRDAAGNLAINPRFIDTFLRWECGRFLLGLGLFPNVQEITESMACVEALREHLPEVLLTDRDVVAVVVGDGRTPRTGALLAMRTKWACVSVDPALHGLTAEPAEAAECQPCATDYSSLPKELRHPGLERQETTSAARAKRARMRADVAGLDRLGICARRVQEARVCFCSRGQAAADPSAEDAAGLPSFTLPLSAAGHVVVVLPHAHVTPDEALAALRFLPDALAAQAAAGRAPAISVVQLPCCGFVHHDTALGRRPDAAFLDARIAAPARAVRVWRDVSAGFDFAGSARGRGVPRRAQDLRASNERKRAGAQATGRRGPVCKQPGARHPALRVSEV